MKELSRWDVFSPHMRQERVMSKASETKNTNITDQKWECKPFSTPQNVIIQSSDHPNPIMAVCPTVCGNHDT